MGDLDVGDYVLFNLHGGHQSKLLGISASRAFFASSTTPPPSSQPKTFTWRDLWHRLTASNSSAIEQVVWDDGMTRVVHRTIPAGETCLRRYVGDNFLNIVVSGSKLDVHDNQGRRIRSVSPISGNVYRLTRHGGSIIAETAHPLVGLGSARTPHLKLVLPPEFLISNVGHSDFVEYVISQKGDRRGRKAKQT